MEKPLLVPALLLSLLLGACGEATTEVFQRGHESGQSPTIPVPTGTQNNPAHIVDLERFIDRTGIWVEGYIVGSEETPLCSTPRDNILLADVAEIQDAAEWLTARVDLEEETEIRARLNIADHPDLVGEKVKVRGDILLVDGQLRIARVTDQIGGREPIVDPVPPSVKPPTTGNVDPERLYGYAEGTTGGEAAEADCVHHFDDSAKFGAWLRLRAKNRETTPTKVYLSGTFTEEQTYDDSSPCFNVEHTSNLSIYGLDGFVMQNVGLTLCEASNIIIRNIHIRMPKADNGAGGISMQTSHNVWIDHCTFESENQSSDYEGGACDITQQSYNVTVSWCRFVKTPKSSSAGRSNTQTADRKITVTFHHNFFDGSSSHHPCVRFGRAHVYNNFYNRVTTYGIGSAYGALVLVEENLFDGVCLPTDICTFPARPSDDGWMSNLQGSMAGYLYERGDLFLNKPADASEPYPLVNVEYTVYDGPKRERPYTYNDFKPSYDYIVDPAVALATIIPSAAGAGRLPGYATAPIPPDNGGMPETTDPTPPNPAAKPIGNGWTLVSCGAAAASASVEAHTLALTACGKFESGDQTFGYVYREVEGDFVATVELSSYSSQVASGNQSLAGILLTPDFSPAATDFLHLLAAQGPRGYHRSWRVAAGDASTKGNLPVPTTDTGAKAVLRLTRHGDKCELSYSLDGGATFGAASSKIFAGLPDKVYIGLAANSGDTKAASANLFSNFTLNGTLLAFSDSE